MKNTLTIAGRQFRGYFNGPVAYIVICLFVVVLGVFFWPPFFLMGRATVRDMFSVAGVLLVLTTPAITMGLLAEEKRTGTIELLITMPVRDWEVILGKYLAALGLTAVMLLMTIGYPISVASLGNLDWGPVWTGYLGLLLQGAGMLAIGVMASSWTENQLIAFFVALVVNAFFWFIDRFLPFFPPSIASPIEWLSMDYHFRSMARGVIDTRDLVFFVSIVALSLGLAFRALESRRWK